MAASGSQSSSGGNTTPFFGCKISLISKSEIRYEGILYTIDPKESTIALAKVRSFGSEDRQVERPVPPRDDIFEFIIFRASDIKDLIVDDPPPAPQLTDPAIIQAHSTSTSFPSSFPPGSINPAGGAAGLPSGPAPVVPSSVAASSAQASKPSAIQQLQQQSQAQQHHQQQQKARQLQQQQLLQQQQQHQQQQSGESSQTDSSQQQQQAKQQQSKPTASNVAGAPGYSKVAGGGQLSAASSQQPKPLSNNVNQRQQQQPNANTLSKPQNKPDGLGGLGQRLSQPLSSQQRGGDERQQRDQQQNGYVNRRQNQQSRVIGENQNPNYHSSQNGQNRLSSSGGHQGQGQQQQVGGGSGFRSFNQRFTPRGGMQGQQQFGGGGGAFRRGGGQGGYGQSQMQRNYVNNRPGGGLNGPKFPPLPDGDFDFEKSQAEFKLLEEKLMALKINGTAGGDQGGEGGSANADSTDIVVPGIPLSAISVAALEQQDLSGEPCYNKTKSFFDSISCEALEREKGSVQRVDWKQERKLNRETFGVVSARRPTFFRTNNRGGGFGGGYHQHRGGYHRGGYGGGGGGNYQNRGHRDQNSLQNQNPNLQQRGEMQRDNFGGGSHQQRGPPGQSGGGGQQQQQRTSQSSINNNVSSTTNGGGLGGRTPAKNSSPNGVGSSPSAASAPIAAKN